MALRKSDPAPKPDITEVFDMQTPRFHWYERAGGSWIPEQAVGYVYSGLVVHWRENDTPSGLSLPEAIKLAASDAYYHAFRRDWSEEIPGLQGSDGIQYHYYIIDGYTLQVTPEDKHTWHASRANAWSLSVCIAAGWHDVLNEKNVQALYALLRWFCYGRADLPLVTARPQVATVNGQRVTTHGVLMHDEARAIEGLPAKGCCGIYKQAVADWRRAQ